MATWPTRPSHPPAHAGFLALCFPRTLMGTVVPHVRLSPRRLAPSPTAGLAPSALKGNLRDWWGGHGSERGGCPRAPRACPWAGRGLCRGYGLRVASLPLGNVSCLLFSRQYT